jgi:3-dehydroquinate synthase
MTTRDHLAEAPTTVPVRLGDRSYDALVGEGLLARLGEVLAAEFPGKPRVALVTDSNVAEHYAEAATRALEDAGFKPTPIVIPAGEASKSLASVESITREMTRAGLDRGSLLVALGGGVVGDVAGFAAAVFFRGIPCVQVPTTVVAQVDSSVGGKTGVNLPEGKNLVGAFHQPRMVVADTATLATLPDREFREGFAEVIKHAAIRDPAMLQVLPDPGGSRAGLSPLIARNIAIKARIVEEDEHESSGTRALLNFGHTIGHGIEAAAGYGRLLHGEAIALGTRAALALSVGHAGLAVADAEAVTRQLDRFGLPDRLPDGVSTGAVLDAVRVDKKAHGGQLRFVLLRALGDAFLTGEIPFDAISAATEALRRP